MSTTPRTDDAQWGTGKVTTDFARTLERELADAKSKLDEEIRLNATLVSDLQAAQARIVELEAE